MLKPGLLWHLGPGGVFCASKPRSEVPLIKRVAIIGAGPSGIVAAKFLQQEGLNPVLFEQSDQVGGQWHTDNSLSGIWPGMSTNTSRIMTQFSDLEQLPDTPAFPAAEHIHAYLLRYMDTFALRPLLRLNSRVQQIEPVPGGGWRVRYRGTTEAEQQEYFEYVLIATGRFNQPFIPRVQGLEGETGQAALVTVSHSHRFKGAEVFSGKRVLVAGGAISALEIATALASRGDVDVSCAYRNQRYVLGKLAGGVPTDHLNFSLYEALAAERLDSAKLAAQLKEFIEHEFGNPAAFGAPAPHEDLRVAGVTKCDHFLERVAEKRIRIRPWLNRVEGKTVYFTDGEAEPFDHILFATGYQLAFPFLRPEEARIMNLDASHIGLFQHTFHADLPGLALVGFYNQVGPYFPVLELQARWIAYSWSGRLPAPAENILRQGCEEYLKTWQQQQKIPMHKLAMLFARAIGAEPRPDEWGGLERELWFGPLCAAVFRLSGPDALENAPELTRAASRAFDMITSPEITAGEHQRLKAINGALPT